MLDTRHGIREREMMPKSGSGAAPDKGMVNEVKDERRARPPKLPPRESMSGPRKQVPLHRVGFPTPPGPK